MNRTTRMDGDAPLNKIPGGTRKSSQQSRLVNVFNTIFLVNLPIWLYLNGLNYM